MNTTTFSERFGHRAPDAEITVRDDAPLALRHALPQLVYGLGVQPSALRRIVCGVLLAAPDKSNWTERPNIEDEVARLIEEAPWFEVYNLIEALPQHLRGAGQADAFAGQLNAFFYRTGIGWQLTNGRLEVRGTELFELAVRQGRDELWNAGKTTAAQELHEALQDLSRRPVAEITGAIQHGMAALECMARDKAKTTATLGDLLRQNPQLFPKPIDQVVDKLWGYTSNYGRHLQEGKPPSFEEAELVVGLCGVLCRYLGRKI
ncbi:MAG: hypothetical protein H0W24_09240 [Lysobacter sp.]|nr:hypothetical protein [Lysobacter sp.]